MSQKKIGYCSFPDLKDHEALKLSNNFSFIRYAVGFMDFENSSKKRSE